MINKVLQKDMYVKDVLDGLNIKDVAIKTDEEFESDNYKYGNVVDDLDIMENDLLTHYKDLDVETYIKLRQIDLMKKMIDKLDNLEMLYDVQNQIKALHNK